MVATQAKRERPVEVSAGDLYIRLAESEAEVRAAQRLRYRVFCEEMKATPTPEMAAAGREFDRYDDFCDHLLVFDLACGRGPEAVIGTYRFLRREAARRCGQFYTADEYDISALVAYPGEIMELGRSCVDRGYRGGTTMQALWRGIAEYVLHFDVQVMFGCASLHGTDPEALAEELAYLYHHHLAPPALRPRALPGRHVDLNRRSPEEIRPKRALAKLPPLLKGYLRLGGMVGDGAFIDYDFNTTDVCMVVQTRLVTDRYSRHYRREVLGKADG